jgi:hypothetical protein
MTIDPSEVMRSYIIDLECYNLAEQAGMFCEALKEAVTDFPDLFDGMRFDFYAEEPYELQFIWDVGDIRAMLTFKGDPDLSTWSVVCSRKRTRGAIGIDRSASCRRFLQSLSSIRALDSKE